MIKSCPQILIVDDDQPIRELISETLVLHGYATHPAHDGIALFQQLQRQAIDLILLDIMMPGEDGISLCQQIRKTTDIPIIMITAVTEDTDRIVALELGADDFLCKPFIPRELVARVKAVLRRTQPHSPPLTSQHTVFTFAEWTFDKNQRKLMSPEKMEVTLTNNDYKLLSIFVSHPQAPISRDKLAMLCNQTTLEATNRSIDIQISRLRQKIEDDPKSPTLIKTVRNEGYLFTPLVETHQ